MPKRFRAGPLARGCSGLAMLLLAACGLAGRGGTPAVDEAQDLRIRRAVEARLEAEPALRDGSFRVQVQGAMVLLHGSVPGMGAWRCALTNASLVPDVRSVVDYLVIQRGPPNVRCLAPEAAPGPAAAVKR